MFIFQFLYSSQCNNGLLLLMATVHAIFYQKKMCNNNKIKCVTIMSKYCFARCNTRVLDLCCFKNTRAVGQKKTSCLKYIFKNYTAFTFSFDLSYLGAQHALFKMGVQNIQLVLQQSLFFILFSLLNESFLWIYFQHKQRSLCTFG